jgi:ribosomal 50S subunit-recycling heat shock protein
MTEPIVLVVPDDSDEDRLDRFLGANAPNLSRTRAKDIIVQGLVTVNGAPAKPSARSSVRRRRTVRWTWSTRTTTSS